MPHLRRDQSVAIKLTTAQTLRSALDAVGSSTLIAGEWIEVGELLDDLRRAIESNDHDRLSQIEARLNNLAFAGRVRDRLGRSGRPAPAVAPTKQSPALPVAGAVCGAALLGLGWSLGGGVLLIGTGGLALFVLGIALAGTTTVSRRRGGESEQPSEVPTPAPEGIVQVLTELGLDLDGRQEMGRPAPE